jgi:hypothetical protein
MYLWLKITVFAEVAADALRPGKRGKLRISNSFYAAKNAFSPFIQVILCEIHNRPWFLDSLKIFQTLHQDLPLKLLIKGIPHGMAQRKRDEESSRWVYLLSYRPIERNGNRQDSLSLDRSLNQSHGLIADSSGWG